MNDNEKFDMSFRVVLQKEFNTKLCPICGMGTVIMCPDHGTANRIVEGVNYNRKVFVISRAFMGLKSAFIFSLGMLAFFLLFGKTVNLGAEFALGASIQALFFGSLYALSIILFFAFTYINKKMKLKNEIKDIIASVEKGVTK